MWGLGWKSSRTSCVVRFVCVCECVVIVCFGFLFCILERKEKRGEKREGRERESRYDQG